MTIITDTPTPITTAYTAAYRYGLDILNSDDVVITSRDFETKAERDNYVTFIDGRPEYRPQGADSFVPWERVMTYQPVPRYDYGARNKRAARVVFEWMWM